MHDVRGTSQVPVDVKVQWVVDIAVSTWATGCPPNQMHSYAIPGGCWSSFTSSPSGSAGSLRNRRLLQSVSPRNHAMITDKASICSDALGGDQPFRTASDVVPGTTKVFVLSSKVRGR